MVVRGEKERTRSSIFHRRMTPSHEPASGIDELRNDGVA